MTDQQPPAHSEPGDAPSGRSLRERAEEMLKAPHADIDEMSMEDVRGLLHELRVHQIELEIQNENLRESQVDLAQSRDRYSDLYEFAPVGYLTLDRHGVIQQAKPDGGLYAERGSADPVAGKSREFCQQSLSGRLASASNVRVPKSRITV